MLCHLTSPRPDLIVKTIKFRKLKSMDIDSFIRDVRPCALCEDKQLLTTVELDIYVKEYNSTLSAALDRHATQKTRTLVTRPTVPWYNKTIDIAKRARRKAERKWRKTRLE